MNAPSPTTSGSYSWNDREHRGTEVDDMRVRVFGPVPVTSLSSVHLVRFTVRPAFPSLCSVHLGSQFAPNVTV